MQKKHKKKYQPPFYQLETSLATAMKKVAREIVKTESPLADIFIRVFARNRWELPL